MMKSALGKLLYGALFTVALPVVLAVWAIETQDLVKLSAIHSLPWGIGTVAAGSLLVALGMASLWWVGGGLPMNAFPPPRYVSSGIYGLFLVSDLSRLFAGVHRRCNHRGLCQWLVAGLYHRYPRERRAGAGIRTARFAGTFRQCVSRATPVARRRPICHLPGWSAFAVI